MMRQLSRRRPAHRMKLAASYLLKQLRHNFRLFQMLFHCRGLACRLQSGECCSIQVQVYAFTCITVYGVCCRNRRVRVLGTEP
jgi:hypothetical protein